MPTVQATPIATKAQAPLFVQEPEDLHLMSNSPAIDAGSSTGADICNNIYNDCDGQTDEDIDPDPASCMAGFMELIESLAQQGAVPSIFASYLTGLLGQAIANLNPGQTREGINQIATFNTQLSALARFPSSQRFYLVIKKLVYSKKIILDG